MVNYENQAYPRTLFECVKFEDARIFAHEKVSGRRTITARYTETIRDN